MIHRRDLGKIARMHKQLWHRKLFGKSPFRGQDELLKTHFAGPGSDPCSSFETLIHYFWDAQQHYLHNTGTLAYYPGAGSIYGARNDGIEGVTRLLPLWAAYRNSPRRASADPELAPRHRPHAARGRQGPTRPRPRHRGA
jgi:hypothetical protein